MCHWSTSEISPHDKQLCHVEQDSLSCEAILFHMTINIFYEEQNCSTWNFLLHGRCPRQIFTNIYPNIYPQIFLFRIFLLYITLNKEHAIAPPQYQCKWKYFPWLKIRLCKLCDKRFCVKMRTKIYIFSCTSDIKKHFKNTVYI